ncbi:hypothetical protein [Saccharothrix sp. ALI-22-I]|uniref:hypothetical protein n=1 Tax=Saccharothrix sp. ALI-22-I TaxID=1933778 RepID=UPI0015C40472|nr:hypothetical protein [Saccharothrix sp. ALI-22-I]
MPPTVNSTGSGMAVPEAAPDPADVAMATQFLARLKLVPLEKSSSPAELRGRQPEGMLW